MSILVHPPLILLAVMFILGVVYFDDQLVFRYILPEHFMVNKLDLTCECISKIHLNYVT